jgi:hypothetical protein
MLRENATRADALAPPMLERSALCVERNLASCVADTKLDHQIWPAVLPRTVLPPSPRSRRDNESDRQILSLPAAARCLRQCRVARCAPRWRRAKHAPYGFPTTVSFQPSVKCLAPGTGKTFRGEGNGGVAHRRFAWHEIDRYLRKLRGRPLGGIHWARARRPARYHLSGLQGGGRRSLRRRHPRACAASLARLRTDHLD